jgi:hypothetical protein
MSRKRVFTVRRLTVTSLSLLAVAGCSQVIGLGDYKVGSGDSDSGTAEAGSSAAGSSAAGSSESGAGGDTVMTKGDGGAGKPGKSDGGATSGGTGGEAGALSEGGSAGTSVAGSGVGGTGVAGSGAGGSAGRGGAGGSAGASGGSAGVGGACPTGCDDGIPCTIDLCDSTGCVHTPADALCSGTCMKCSATLGCVDHSTTTELLTDGAFDTAPVTGWTSVSSHTDDAGNNTTPDTLTLIGAPPVGITAKSTPDVVALGFKNDEASWVYQPVTIPAAAVALNLTGYIYVKSVDTVPDSDIAFIDLITDVTDPDTDQSYLSTFSKVWANEQSGSGWITISESGDLTTIPPAQSIWIAVYAVNDVSDISNFYFDSLSLKAKVCTP